MTATPSVQLVANRLRMMEESATMRVMIAALKMKAEGIDIVDLGAGEPDFNTPVNIKEAGKRAIDNNITRYTPAAGTLQLRDAILQRYQTDFGVTRRREEVLATAGGKQSIFNAMLAVINPGDDVLIPAPYWVTIPQIVYLCEGNPVEFQLSPNDGFQLTASLVEENLTPRTRLIVVNSPSNPTGAVIPKDEFYKICRLAAERDIYLLSDECYQRVLYDGLEPYTAAAAPENLRHRIIVSGSLSKTYAMTGWRLGYTIAPSELISQMIKIQSHETSNPSSISQAAAIEALTGPQDSVNEMICEYRRRRDFLVPALNSLPGVRCLKPQGAFYVWPDIREHLHGPIRNSTEFAERLLREVHVAVTPGTGFGTEGYIRISYAAAFTDLQEAVRRLEIFLKGL